MRIRGGARRPLGVWLWLDLWNLGTFGIRFLGFGKHAKNAIGGRDSISSPFLFFKIVSLFEPNPEEMLQMGLLC